MDDDTLTAEEQAALDAQRNAPEPAKEPPAREAPEQAPSETPQEAPTEPEAPEGTDPPEATDKRKMVEHAALVQERERRKELERQAAEDRRRYEARFEELLKLVPQPVQQQPPAEQATAIPDPNADPVGHIVGTMRQLGASQEQITQRLAQYEQQREQQQAIMAVQQRATALEAEYRAQNPEYDAAFQHLQQFHDRYLQASGWTDPAQRAQKLAADKFSVVVAALQQGANPAERLHRMAEASGWRPQQQPAAGGASAQQPAAPQVPDEAARLRMLQQGQEHARGLGGVRGNGPSPLTGQKLADMDEDTFLDFIKNNKQNARRFMGA